MTKIIGKVKAANAGSKSNPDISGLLNPHSYIIEDKDGNTYFAHMGDIGGNEDVLIEIARQNQLERLQEGDTVEFEPRLNQNRAIHVRKIP